jgi:hypothetical protein
MMLFCAQFITREKQEPSSENIVIIVYVDDVLVVTTAAN